MSFTLTTSGAILANAGLQADSTIIASGAALSQWSDDAEAEIYAETRYDWVTNYSAVKTNAKAILSATAAAHAAMKVINYSTLDYPTLTDAHKKIDVLYDQFRRGIRILKEDNTKKVI